MIRSWKAPIALGIFAVIALLVAFLAPKSGSSTFKLSTDGDAIQIPPITVPTGPTVVIVAILLALLALVSAAIVAFGSRVDTLLCHEVRPHSVPNDENNMVCRGRPRGDAQKNCGNGDPKEMHAK